MSQPTTKPITPEEALAEMQNLRGSDEERRHSSGDGVLYQIIEEHLPEFKPALEEWNSWIKWYA